MPLQQCVRAFYETRITTEERGGTNKGEWEVMVFTALLSVFLQMGGAEGHWI